MNKVELFSRHVNVTGNIAELAKPQQTQLKNFVSDYRVREAVYLTVALEANRMESASTITN